MGIWNRDYMRDDRRGSWWAPAAHRRRGVPGWLVLAVLALGLLIVLLVTQPASAPHAGGRLVRTHVR